MIDSGKTHGASGFILGLFLWAVTVNYLRGGPTQVKGWFHAKFFNDPQSPTGAAK